MVGIETIENEVDWTDCLAVVARERKIEDKREKLSSISLLPILSYSILDSAIVHRTMDKFPALHCTLDY